MDVRTILSASRIAFVFAVAILGVCLCAAAHVGWADESAAIEEGDSSKSGAVVQRDETSQGAGASASSSAAKRQDEASQPASAEADAGEDASDDSAGDVASLQPLDAEGNAINEGQVSDNSFLYDAAIADLAGADAYYNGQTVQVTGEAVGEAIVPLGSSGEGSDLVRVTLYEASSGSSVTVFMTANEASKVTTYGAYGKTGATLRVQGVFNLTCKDHEGESDIHAETVVVVSQGAVHPDAIVVEKFIPGAVVLVVGLIFMGVFRYLKERSR